MYYVLASGTLSLDDPQKVKERCVYFHAFTLVYREEGIRSFGEQMDYLDKEGCKKTGWLKSKGCWYYFNENGEMASNTWIDNYYVNSDGKWKGTR